MTRSIILTTDDGRDPAYESMRAAVLADAGRRGDRVILYDRSAESYFVDPYPSGTWTAEVEDGPSRERLLEPEDLEMLGRRYLATQVGEARRQGVDAHAWLPPRPGARGMAEAVERFGAEIVILPATILEPSLVDRVRGNTLERLSQQVPAQVVVADGSGIRERSGAPSA